MKVRVSGATIARKNTCVINKLINHTTVLCPPEYKPEPDDGVYKKCK